MKKSYVSWNTHDDRGIKTFKAQPSWMTPDLDGHFKVEPIDPSKNEFFLWHGTSPQACEKITSGDFRLDRAGSN